MDLRVLGPIEVRVDEQVVPVRPGLPRKLLALLVLRLGERISADTLVELLWHDAPPANSSNALQILVSYLRKALSGRPGAPSIETVDRGYRLVADPDRVDAYRLEAVVTRSDASAEVDPLRRLQLLDSALSSWRGPPFPEIADEELAQSALHRLEEARLSAHEQLVDILLSLGRHTEAAVDLQGLIQDHPLRERFHALLMQALYRAGRQAEALAVYEKARTILREELGLDPGPELRAMEQAVLRQAPELRPAIPEPGEDRVVDPAAGDVLDAGPTYPKPLESLIGREPEVSRLLDLMRARRMITLIGPGGAGKTRLAAELAARTERPVWWVDLSSAEDRDQVLSAVAKATGTVWRSGDDGRGLADQLGRHDGVLVLDTCERVRTEVRSLVEAVLRAGDDLSITATSRQPLAAATELAWPVPPLSLPHPESADAEEVGRSAAVRLFVERAANRRVGFELTDTNCTDVARICLLLDGLPLAIELAAAHAGALDPATMLRVLDDRLRLLVDDVRQDRQHTLRSTIAWSYDLLPDEEAVFFDRLSVFAGPFPLEAAVAVAGEGLDRDGLELLLALGRQSLVAVEPDGRYRLLDTVRAFAEERLLERGGEGAAVRGSHAAWYTELLNEAAPVGSTRYVKGWRGELRGAMPDLVRALKWCFTAGEEDRGARLLASLWWLWPREGSFTEAAEWFATAKETVPSGSPQEAALLASSGTYAVTGGDLATAARDCATAAGLFERFGNAPGLARALIPWGIALWGRGDFTGSSRVHERAAAVFEGLDDQWGVALALVLRARTAFDAVEDDARERLAAAEVAARRCGDAHVLAASLVLRARAEVADGAYSEAVRHAEESLRLNDLHGHREGAIGSLHALGLAWVGEGRLEPADRVFSRALTTAVAIQHGGATAESLDGLAIVARQQRRWTDAASLLALADTLRASTGIQRSAPVGGLVAEIHQALAEHLDRDTLLEVRHGVASLDLLQVAAAERTRLSQSMSRQHS